MIVDPKDFSTEMSKRWVDKFNNSLTDELCSAWECMAEVLNSHITGNNTKPITVLPLPTGTGKTQGLCLYCAMLCKSGRHGVLIVTNFKDEANEIASCINDIAGRQFAVAEHSDSRNGGEVIQSMPVLVITHSAYQRAMAAESGDEPYRSKWNKYSQWTYGQRNLTVIDEAIDIVESFDVTLEQLRLLRCLIPSSLDEEFSIEVQAVDGMLNRLEELASGNMKIEEYELIQFDEFSNKDISFSELRKAIYKHLNTHLNYDIHGVDLHKNLVAFANKILDYLEEIIPSWSIYYQIGLLHALRTARFVLPLELKSFVVLDATASANPVTKILEDYLDFADIPIVKSYRNLTLHISTGHGVSKSAMKKVNTKEWGYILDNLGCNELKDMDAPLLCVNKDTENKLSSKKLPANWSIMHWGDINGKNNWKECDSVIVYGFEYLPYHASAANLMAFLNWKYKIKGKNYSSDILRIETPYIKMGYIWGHIIVSLVQAINRAHCRNMTKGGNCPVTDVYLFVKHESDKAVLCHHLAELMPDINIKDWNGPKADSNSLRLNGTERKIVGALKGYKGDKYRIDVMCKDLGIHMNTFNNYQKELKQGKGKIYDALEDIGLSYLSALEARDKFGLKYRQHFIRNK